MLTPALASLLSLTFTCVSHATSYSPPVDFESVSPNGQYRFVADYPESAQLIENLNTIITYTLIETETELVRWSFKGNYYTPVSNEWPSRAYGAYVGNSGGVLIYGPERWVFTALAASDGKVGPRMTYQFKPPYTMQAAGNRNTANNLIMQYSYRGIIEAEGNSYLLTRACWGERRLIGFTEQTLITELTAAQTSACEAAERQWVGSTLARAPERLDAIHQELMPWLLQPIEEREGEARRAIWKYSADLQTAMQMASRFAYRNTIPELHAIARWRAKIPDDGSLSEYTSFRLHSSILETLSDARLALRRLGEQPVNYQPALFEYPAWIESNEQWRRILRDQVALPEVIEYTDSEVDSVSEGMPVRDVIELLGVPDSLLQATKNRRVLEFDIDADLPYTLRIIYTVSNSEFEPVTVETVERITPPRWTIEARRDLELFYRD